MKIEIRKPSIIALSALAASGPTVEAFERPPEDCHLSSPCTHYLPPPDGPHAGHSNGGDRPPTASSIAATGTHSGQVFVNQPYVVASSLGPTGVPTHFIVPFVALTGPPPPGGYGK